MYAKKAAKYRSVKTVADGRRFDSKREAARYGQLRLMERAGEIVNLRCQVPFVLIPKSRHGRAIRYIADFVYLRDGRQVIEDVKGYRTGVYRLKRRMMAELGYPIEEV